MGWKIEDDEKVRNFFINLGSKRVRDMLYGVRKKEDMPHCIVEGPWFTLQSHRTIDD